MSNQHAPHHKGKRRLGRGGCGASLWTGATATLLSVGCTHTLTFSDPAPIVVVGTPPTPPPIDTKPPEPPPPPAPKRVEVQHDQIVIHEKIQFESDQATIKPDSDALLAEIIAVVQDNPQLRRLSIEGHTDSTGSDMHNQALSEQRAAAVRDYLVQHGVDAARLTSRGWGETRPIGDNSTPEGREANRRVEFVILEQDATAPATQPASGEPSAATAAPAAGTDAANAAHEGGAP